MPGEKGLDQMKALMARFRSDPPEVIGGLKVARLRDYLGGTVIEIGGTLHPLDGPTGDMVIFDLEPEGNYVAVRPSGTEAKVKFYSFAFDRPEDSADLEATKANQAHRLDAMEKDLQAFSGT
jgi:phosphoglucomutase/phosphomannomutase